MTGPRFRAEFKLPPDRRKGGISATGRSGIQPAGGGDGPSERPAGVLDVAAQAGLPIPEGYSSMDVQCVQDGPTAEASELTREQGQVGPTGRFWAREATGAVREGCKRLGGPWPEGCRRFESDSDLEAELGGERRVAPECVGRPQPVREFRLRFGLLAVRVARDSEARGTEHMAHWSARPLSRHPINARCSSAGAVLNGRFESPGPPAHGE